jgi:hypothetical protein
MYTHGVLKYCGYSVRNRIEPECCLQTRGQNRYAEEEMTRHEGLLTFLDWITDPPRGGRAQMWVVGAGLATLTFVYGMSCLITQRATVPRTRFRGMGGMNPGVFTEISGDMAVAFGMGMVILSLFIHFQWFWGNHPKLSNYYEIGKYLSLLGLLGMVLYCVYSQLMPLW